MRILSLSLAFFSVATLCNAQGDPKGGDPPPCCPEGSTLVATCTQSSTDPKSGSTTSYTLGQKSEVRIIANGQDITGTGLCVEVGTPLTLSMTGGDDSDGCKNENNDCSMFGVDSDFEWTGSGTSDPNNPKSFIVDTTEPGSISITAKSSEGGGNCNSGSESKSASTTIKVWRVSEILPLNLSQVPRGQNHTWNIEAEGLPVTYLWRSSVTHYTGTSSSWSGWQALDYTLSVEVKLDCPYSGETTIVRTRNVDVVKSRNFNASVENSPKRYTVSSSIQSILFSNDCRNHGKAWGYPFNDGSGQGLEMSEHINVDLISGGPNKGWYYVKDFNSVNFDIDTNTSRNFSDSSTVFYQNHSGSNYFGTSLSGLHNSIKTHEEGHVNFIVAAEATMGSQGNPEDMYDKCEDIVSNISKDAVKGTAAQRIESSISWINITSLGLEVINGHPYDDNNYGTHCGQPNVNCDYYFFFKCPGEHECIWQPNGYCPGGC